MCRLLIIYSACSQHAYSLTLLSCVLLHFNERNVEDRLVDDQKQLESCLLNS